MSINEAEYERRFKARIIAVLSNMPTFWTPEQAKEAADDEWESDDFEHHAYMYDDDPEGSADESLSCWEPD